MVLEGFHFISFLGWITGSFFVSRPWANQLTFSWISLYSLYNLIINTVTLIVTAQFTIQAIRFVRFQSLVSKILNLSLLFGGLIFFLLFRLQFLINAKEICGLLNELKNYGKNSKSVVHFDLLPSWRRYKYYLYFCCVWLFINASLLPAFASKITPDSSVLWLSPPYSFIALYFFSTLPLVITIQLGFSFAVASTFHLLFAIDSMFCELEEQVCIKTRQNNHDDPNPNMNMNANPHVPIVAPFHLLKFRHLDSSSRQLKNEDGSASAIISASGSGKEMNGQEILERIQQSMELCKKFDKIVGPFYLLLIVRIVFFLIHSADTILIDGSYKFDKFSLFKFIFGWIHIIFEFSQLVLIFLGQRFHQRVSFRKDQLLKMIFIAPSCPGKEEMHGVWEMLQVWQWSITACGIFKVDKPLISGVITSMMTYVVILFQINLSDVQQLPLNSNPNCTGTGVN